MPGPTTTAALVEHFVGASGQRVLELLGADIVGHGIGLGAFRMGAEECQGRYRHLVTISIYVHHHAIASSAAVAVQLGMSGVVVGRPDINCGCRR
ncbi:hypothetical protein ACPCG0_09670 [Propionibacteriaceae bacterium Y1923]